jgi:hypothetical protein
MGFADGRTLRACKPGLGEDWASAAQRRFVHPSPTPVLVSPEWVSVLDLRPTVGAHELSPALVEVPMVVLTQGKLAGPGA